MGGLTKKILNRSLDLETRRQRCRIEERSKFYSSGGPIASGFFTIRPPRFALKYLATHSSTASYISACVKIVKMAFLQYVSNRLNAARVGIPSSGGMCDIPHIRARTILTYDLHRGFQPGQRGQL